MIARHHDERRAPDVRTSSSNGASAASVAATFRRRTRRVCASNGGGGRYGACGSKTQPGKPSFAPPRRDPTADQRHGRRRGPLRHHELRRVARLAEPIVVDVEAGVQSEAGMEWERRHERGRRVTRRLEQGRGGPRRRRQAVTAVVAQAVLERILAGQDRGVRRQRDHGVGVGEVEPDTLAGEPVEGRRRRTPSVTPERIRPERVDGDQKDVLPGNRMQVRLARRRRARDAGTETGDRATDAQAQPSSHRLPAFSPELASLQPSALSPS